MIVQNEHTRRLVEGLEKSARPPEGEQFDPMLAAAISQAHSLKRIADVVCAAWKQAKKEIEDGR